jgi:hypothetical protein
VLDKPCSMVYTKVYTEKKEDVMTTITPELKTFMEDLWGAEGDFINTPIGRGRIENVRTKAGIDLEVIVKIPDMDGFTLFNGMELFEMERV